MTERGLFVRSGCGRVDGALSLLFLCLLFAAFVGMLQWTLHGNFLLFFGEQCFGVGEKATCFLIFDESDW
jgi:hypothetical protein